MVNITDEMLIEVVVERSIQFDLSNQFYYALIDNLDWACNYYGRWQIASLFRAGVLKYS